MNAVFKKAALGALLMLGLSMGAAVAGPITETYNISGTFADPYDLQPNGGTFSGTFAVSGAVNSSNIFTNYSITAASISVTGFGPDHGGYTFAPLTYSLSNSALTGAANFDYFELTMAGGNQLEVSFNNSAGATGLSTTGATLVLMSSDEHQTAAGNRTFLSGTVTAQATAVPEPSSITLLGAGLALLAAAFAFRRARKSVAVVA